MTYTAGSGSSNRVRRSEAMAQRSRVVESVLWERVGELADRARHYEDLRHHRLHIFAAAQRRARGDGVSAELARAERHAAAITLSAKPLMRRIREATDEPLIVMKGPEAAVRWPSARLRPWKDLDLLARDGEAVQAALLAAGAVEIGIPVDYQDSHHLRPLAFPDLPISIEVHRRPKWPTLVAPTFDAVAERAAPSALGVPGFLAPCPTHHAVLLAGHAWDHDPLSRVGGLADVAAMALECDPAELEAVARDWGIARVWSTTIRAVDQVLLARRRARAPIWLRHLHETRERTVFEGHVERLVAPVAAAPVVAAPVVAGRAVMEALRPWPGEGWAEKLRRSRMSLRHASMSESEHDVEVRGEQPA